MSRLRSPNGDDYPDAAQKHLLDAGVLVAQQRTDGAAYLSGYVVECALKSLFVLETKSVPQRHRLQSLAQEVSMLATFAGAKCARYFGPATSHVHTSAIASWKPEMRYHSPSMSLGDAQGWHDCARDVFQETVHQMRLDGVL